MRVLLLNQCFYPDVMATAQQLTDLAVGLKGEGHTVTVVSGDRGYDNPSQRFPHRETWSGINIIRIPALALGKQTRWRRAVNFGSFLISCSLILLLLPRFDVVVALTSPPLISFLGSLFVLIKGGKFFFWVMDLNPDEAIAAGWLKENSLTAKALDRLLRYSLLHSERVIALDHFVKGRIVAKGVPEQLVTVLPPWAREDTVWYDQAGRADFRQEYNLEESFVVMYAGNHSPCHQLDTLMEAAKYLSDEVLSQKEIVFCFVGGGSEWKKVRDFGTLHGLLNIRCLPYQPFDRLAGLLSAADLHAVVMGHEFVGIVHPCKLYNILTIGLPFLYIGPKESHIAEIAAKTSDSQTGYRTYTATQGDVQTVVNHILLESKRNLQGQPPRIPEIASRFARHTLLPQMIKVLESQTVTETQISPASETPRYMSAAR